MDNRTDSSESLWVDWVNDRLAGLSPSAEWWPDSNRAFQRIMQRREKVEAEGSGRWIRLSMAAAIVVSIGLVVSLLPWHAFWEGTKTGKNLLPEIQNAATPAVQPAPPTGPPARFQPPAPSSPKHTQKPEEHVGGEVTAPRAAGPEAEPNYSDEARRAHIQGTIAAVQQTAPPAPEQEQKPAERVGPGVTPPRLISSAEPGYTDEARRDKIQGSVTLNVIFRTDGTVKVNKIVRGIGHGLDEKAIEAVQKFTFTPAMKDGKPIDVELEVVINFHLY